MKRRTLRVIATHAVAILIGIISGAVSSVPGSFLTDAVKSVIAGPAYQYGPLTPPCVSAEGWTFAQASVSCAGAALRLAVSSAPATGEAIFIDPQRAFPANYRVTATVSLLSPDSCAGIIARGHSATGTGYAIFVCARGVWELARFDPLAPQPMLLATGILSPSPQHAYTIAFVTQGAIYQSLINGVVTGGGDENLYPGTSSIALVVSPTGSADFSDFAISENR